MDGLFEEQRPQSQLLRRDEVIQFGELDAHIVPWGKNLILPRNRMRALWRPQIRRSQPKRAALTV